MICLFWNEKFSDTDLSLNSGVHIKNFNFMCKQMKARNKMYNSQTSRRIEISKPVKC
jgi:hypothetical protein